MIENSKVMIRIDYESDGIRRAFHGEIDKNKFDALRIEYECNETRRASHEEIDENKLDELHSRDENFICLVNDGKIAWIDKEAILSFDELETKLHVYEKFGMGAATFAAKKELRIRF